MSTVENQAILQSQCIEALEKHVNELPTPNKVFYKPKGYDDYLDMKQNYDELYGRIIKLEGRLDGLQN